MINQNVKGKCTAHEKNKKTEYKCKILKYAIWLKWVKGGFQMRRENIKIAIYLYLNHKGWKCNQWNYINLFMSYWKYLLVQHKFTYRKIELLKVWFRYFNVTCLYQIYNIRIIFSTTLFYLHDMHPMGTIVSIFIAAGSPTTTLIDIL